MHDGLSQNRESLVIATKGGLRIDAEQGLVRDSSPAWLRRGVEQSLRHLGVEYIDLYQVHWPDPHTPFAASAQALEELVAEGKIRHVGVSNFGVAEMAEFARTRAVETLQPPYHLFRREIESDVLPYAREHDIGVLAYGPLAHGLLTGAMDESTSFPPGDWRSNSDLFSGEAFERNLKTVGQLKRLAQSRGYSVGQLAIAWTLANPAVQVAIVGSRSIEHIEDSLGALEVESLGRMI